ncbi:tetraspanin-33-like isoform X1 [Patiria miniata]|uniref:Tetraspanin n=1 Tax=Patiria miniata TaxID=46514 RepID=A0A914B3P1_PATMI|nr:tetraspanin-33-like isoform X1 [Patiria miniata]
MNEGRDLAKTHINPCIKYTLFVLNFLLWVFSIGLIIIGVWALIERQNTNHIQIWAVIESQNSTHIKSNQQDIFTGSSIVLIVTGSVSFILGFTGFLGALRENCCLLLFFLLFMFLIIILEGSAGTLAFDYSRAFYLTVDEIVERSIAQYRTDLDLTNFIDFAQRTLECCGGDGGYKDWSLNRYFDCTEENPSREKCGVPYSCCMKTEDANGDPNIINTQCGLFTREQYLVPAKVSNEIHTAGCVDKFLVYLSQKSYIVGPTALSVAAVQLLVMLLALRLHQQIKLECSRYHKCKKRGINNFA